MPVNLVFPTFYSKQREAIYSPARIALIEASTKSGKTLGCMTWLLEQALRVGGGNYWWVAPVYETAKIAYRRYKEPKAIGLPEFKFGLGEYPHFLFNDSDLSLRLPNNSLMSFRSAEHPDRLYGADVKATVLDEASRMREEAWHAVRTTLAATSGEARIIGNVHGRHNWFWRLARQAEQGEVGLAAYKIVAADAVAAGILSEAEVESARRTLPGPVFRELFLAEAAEDVQNPFGMSAIAACTAPLSTRAPVAWGLDVARKVDYVALIGLDDAGAVCRFEHWQSPWRETIERVRYLVGGAPCLVDSTGIGDMVVEYLQREAGPSYEGYLFTPRSKQQLLEGLAMGIQQRRITFPEGRISNELEQFEYTYTRTGVLYSAPEGLHDDCVIALALAWRQREQGSPGGAGVWRELYGAKSKVKWPR